MPEFYEKTEDPGEVFRRLHTKFGVNFDLALKAHSPALKAVELRARAISSVKQILASIQTISATQREILTVFDEVFADVICSLYLAGCALDKPAQMVLRRALELGIGVVYLWDMPHVFWGWKCHDYDLNFNDMVEHLASVSFKSYVDSCDPHSPPGDVLETAATNKVYRILSNIVHGKITSFESQLQDRFNHTTTDWDAHLELVKTVEDLLLNLWRRRFKPVEDHLLQIQPQLAAN